MDRHRLRLPLAARGPAGVVAAQTLVRTSRLAREVDPDHIDPWVAPLVACFPAQADQPVWPGGLPAIREHQRFHARCYLDWRGSRRGWS